MMPMISIIAPAQEVGLPWWPLVVVIVFLLLMNIINNRVAPSSHFLLWSFAGSVVLLAIGLLDGNTWSDMGLGWSYLIPGLIWAGGCIGVVTLAYLVGTLFKPTRDAFKDERHAELSGGRLAFHALLEVPFGTVLLEEIAFRSVLFFKISLRRMSQVAGCSFKPA